MFAPKSMERMALTILTHWFPNVDPEILRAFVSVVIYLYENTDDIKIDFEVAQLKAQIKAGLKELGIEVDVIEEGVKE